MIRFQDSQPVLVKELRSLTRDEQWLAAVTGDLRD